MTAQQFQELKLKGWTEINSSNEDSILINLAQRLGEIVNHPKGNIIDYLTPKNKFEAIKDTLSYNFEYDDFPLHTDTAFWKEPARYVLMSSETNNNTATTILNAKEIISLLSLKEINEIKKSIFLVKTPSYNFYTSLINKHNNQTFFRFDRNCMKPINQSAEFTNEIIEEKINMLNINKIIWDKPKAFILNNWLTIHGRESIKNDKNRILKRIYIK
jgi:alpha-ketoglutarate-dependent taurine dioxygenase